MTPPMNPVPSAHPENAGGSVPLRASDADREQVVQALHAAVGLGLLTLAEGDERVADAYRAQHLRDLAPLLADLPKLPVRRPQPPGWRALATLFWLQLHAWLRAGSRPVRGRRVNARLVLSVLGTLLLAALIVGGLFKIDLG